MLELEPVEFYLSDRINRKHYMDMIPVLLGIKEMRLKEIEDEKAFVKLLAGELGDGSERGIWNAAEWWKNKVIMKRPLTEDDKKAWRMIRSRVSKTQIGDL